MLGHCARDGEFTHWQILEPSAVTVRSVTDETGCDSWCCARWLISTAPYRPRKHLVSYLFPSIFGDSGEWMSGNAEEAPAETSGGRGASLGAWNLKPRASVKAFFIYRNPQLSTICKGCGTDCLGWAEITLPTGSG